jgi:hypothetical protein
MEALLKNGDFSGGELGMKKAIFVFRELSFTDTMEEHDVLQEKIPSQLHIICKEHGIECFFDMRCGGTSVAWSAPLNELSYLDMSHKYGLKL